MMFYPKPDMATMVRIAYNNLKNSPMFRLQAKELIRFSARATLRFRHTHN